MNLRNLEARLKRVEEQVTPRGGVMVEFIFTDDPAEAQRRWEAASAAARTRGAKLVFYEFEGVPA